MHEEGTAREVRFEAGAELRGLNNSGPFFTGGTKLEHTPRHQIAADLVEHRNTYDVAGWTKSRAHLRSVGMEYGSVRMAVVPVSTCVYSAKSASKSSFALLTGIEKLSQSPAGEAVVASMSFSLSQANTAEEAAGFGAT